MDLFSCKQNLSPMKSGVQKKACSQCARSSETVMTATTGGGGRCESVAMLLKTDTGQILFHQLNDVSSDFVRDKSET